MALLMLESFDKYGGPNSNNANVVALLTQGEWTTTFGPGSTIVAPLSATGYALSCVAGAGVTKTLSGSYPRLIGGFRFNSSLLGISSLQFLDGASNQAGFSINTNGTISARNGVASGGTVLGTSAASITASTTHYIEFDFTFANSGTYQIWMDGVSILSGSGDTTTTANNTANGFSITGAGSGGMIIDDLYLFDASGTINNAVLLTSPRIETQFPVSDASIQFAVGAAVLGSSVAVVSTSQNTSANVMKLKAITSPVNCTLTSLGLIGGSAGAIAVNFRPVVYSSSSGSPNTLLGSGAIILGPAANTGKNLPLTSAVSLVAGTQYYIGYMTDVAGTNALTNSGQTDMVSATATFASGAPATAPAMSASQGAHIWANLSATSNWQAISQNPSQGSLSYTYDATVGHQDNYNFPPLSVTPTNIYATAIKVSVSKSDAGAKTLSVRQKSGATDSSGSGGIQAPGTSYAWITSLFPTDPNTGAAWTLAALNAAQAGLRIES